VGYVPASAADDMSDIQALTATVDQLERGFNFWNSWAIAFTLAAAVAATGYFVTSWMANSKGTQLKEAQSGLLRAKDDQLARDLAEKERQIADSIDKAARANLEAGRANERAGNIEQQNLTLRAEQQKVQTELSKQQQRTANAERELAEVKRLQLPRSIPLNLRAQMIGRLKPFAGQVLRVVLPMADDLETNQFARQIEALVIDAGWKYQVVMRSGISSSPPHGLLCVVGDLGNPPPAAIALVTALKEAGAQIVLVNQAVTDPNIVGLVVGLKPIQ
jgi:outer membrane murein-binding lipoprotein Lpp